jgi:xanthomonalisin
MPRMRRLFHLALATIPVAGCATAMHGEQIGGVDSGTEGGGSDSGGGGGSDSGGEDAPPEMHPDAGVTTPDSGSSCTVMTRDLLVNGNFDGTPVGTGWTAMPAVASDQLVTPNDGVAEQSAPNKAWLGGIAQANAKDTLHQDVMVPAGTTMLVLTGYYDVRTQETGSTVYDTGKAEITDTSGTVLATVLSLDNAHAKTAWTAINFTIPGNLSGQTIRVRFTSNNDGLNPTSFYFDSLVLQATYCQ